MPSQAGFTYNIDPDNEPYTCFFYDEPWVDNKYFISLPKASKYDGLEIQIYIKRQLPDTRTFYNRPAIYIKCSDADDHLYVKENTSQINNITVENLNCSYKDFKGTTVMLQLNRMSKFKSIGGNWYAIEGVFTGE